MHHPNASSHLHGRAAAVSHQLAVQVAQHREIPHSAGLALGLRPVHLARITVPCMRDQLQIAAGGQGGEVTVVEVLIAPHGSCCVVPHVYECV